MVFATLLTATIPLSALPVFDWPTEPAIETILAFPRPGLDELAAKPKFAPDIFKVDELANACVVSVTLLDAMAAPKPNLPPMATDPAIDTIKESLVAVTDESAVSVTEAPSTIDDCVVFVISLIVTEPANA